MTCDAVRAGQDEQPKTKQTTAVARTQPVHHKPRTGLPHTGNHEKGGHQGPSSEKACPNSLHVEQETRAAARGAQSASWYGASPTKPITVASSRRLGVGARVWAVMASW